MEGLLSALRNEGWYLKTAAIETLKGSKCNYSEVITKALNCDLCEIGEKCIQETIASSDDGILNGPFVLQVGKIRNVSAPKDNEHSSVAPRMLKLSLTDGSNTVNAIEYEQLSDISLKTPPGTKVKLVGRIVLSQGCIKLTRSCVKVLGGRVEKLYTKWKIAQDMNAISRMDIQSDSGPPPFVAFGKRTGGAKRFDKSVKSLQANTKGEEEENTEFTAQRKAAIANASHKRDDKKGTLSDPRDKFGKMPVGEPKAKPRPASNYERNQHYIEPEPETTDPKKSVRMYRELSTESGHAVHQKTVNEFVSMGFKYEDVVLCLRKANNDFEEAMDLLTAIPEKNSVPQQSHNQNSRGQFNKSRGRGRHRGNSHLEDAEQEQSSSPATLMDFIDNRMSNMLISSKQEVSQEDKKYTRHGGHESYRGNHRGNESNQGNYRGDESNRGNYRGNGSNQGNYRGDESNWGNGSNRGNYRGDESNRGNYRGNGSNRGNYRDNESNRGNYRGNKSTRGNHRGNESHRGTYRGSEYRGSYTGNESYRGNHRSNESHGSTYRGSESQWGHNSRGHRRGGYNQQYGRQEDQSTQNSNRYQDSGTNNAQKHSAENFKHPQDKPHNQSYSGQRNASKSFSPSQRNNEDNRPQQRNPSQSFGPSHTRDEIFKKPVSIKDNASMPRNSSSNSKHRDHQENKVVEVPPNPPHQYHRRGAKNDKSTVFNDLPLNPPPQRGPTTFGDPSSGATSHPVDTGSQSQRSQIPTTFQVDVTQSLHVTMPQWQRGSHCLAKYWEDSQYYHGIITDIHPEAPTAVVQFVDFGNYEEVGLYDLKPFVPWNETPTQGMQHA